MAAVARGFEPPDSMNARIPCPLCGGLLHPVAGRCKHCKQDVTTHRVRGNGPAGMLPQLAPFVGQPGAAAVALGPSAYPLEQSPQARRAAWLRNWPLLVILLAVLGMIVALVLLVLPQSDSSVRRRGGTPLHNDRMETDKLPGSGRGNGTVDPWQSTTPKGSGPSSRAPSPPPPSGSGVDPGDPTASDPFAGGAADPTLVDPDDSQGGVAGGVLGGGGADDVVVPDLIDPFDDDPDPTAIDPSDPLAGTLRSLPPTRNNILALMAFHLCQRAATCGSDPVNQRICERMMTSLSTRPSACFHPVKARMCLRRIDALPCSSLPTASRLQSIPVCEELMTC